MTTEKIIMFKNRVEKVYRHLGRHARRLHCSCYRVYDHDLPEFPLRIELYEDKLYVAEYKRKHRMADDEHQQWLLETTKILSEIFELGEENIFLKLRHRKSGRAGQYQKTAETKREFIVSENGLKFIINLSDYVDTGLFLDHRLTRQMVREQAPQKNVLNLFSYTGSFSVYAAAGEAAEVTSVDLSKTYLNWAKRNMDLNGFSGGQKYRYIQADVKQYLKTVSRNYFDIVIMDPPTFSNSKRMEEFMDIQKDHVDLINECLESIKANGILFFSSNSSTFSLETDKIKAKSIKDITKQTTPFDFEGRAVRKCYSIFK